MAVFRTISTRIVTNAPQQYIPRAIQIRVSPPTKTPETPVFREFFHARKQALALFLALHVAPSPLKPLKKEGDGSFRPPPAVLVLFYADNSSVSFSPALPTSGGRRCRPHPDRWPSGTPAQRPLSCFRRCRPRCRSQIFTLQNWRDSLDTVALTLPYADTGKHAYTPDWSKLPSGQT